MIINQKPSGDTSHTIWQRLSVDSAYPVIFTNALFRCTNTVLRDTINYLEPTKCYRMVVFLDTGVADIFPGLAAVIARYLRG